MENKVNVFNFSDVFNRETGKTILSGNDHFIGQNEKRRNDKVIHISFPYNHCNYSLFYKGTNDILEKACIAIENLLNNPNLSEKKKSEYYKILIDSLHVVHHKSTKERKSKLHGINSLSTSCIDNCFCRERIEQKESICAHCFATTQQKQQLALQDRNTINGVILRNILIPSKYWKKYFRHENLSKFFRIESFGDVANKVQALNYIEFAKAFPRVHFAWWTKNTGICHFAFLESGKPENISFIASSFKLNKEELYHKKTFSEIDHIFTVFDKEYIKENNVTITCGGLSCMECIKKHKNCYFTDTELSVKEELK